ncbi:MAG: succinate--CoA ligase subunit alpha [Candidatus Woesearchaeota archaeon]
MMILIDKDTKVIVQGLTGKQGSFHAGKMKEYGTQVVAGVTPRKGGTKVDGIPVYNSIKEALEKHEASWSIIFVPAKFAKEAALEAIENGLNIVLITEGVPVHDSIKIVQEAKSLTVIGPNCPGMISPGASKLGIMPGHVFKKGKVGVISRSGTLTYEIVEELTKAGIGQSTVVGVGGDPVLGSSFIDLLELFERDKDTEKVVIIGEIGGDMEEKTADFIKENFSKPVVAYIAGTTAPEGKKMGHAGAVISGSSGTAAAKIKKLKEAGVKVARLPSEVAKLLL